MITAWLERRRTRLDLAHRLLAAEESARFHDDRANRLVSQCFKQAARITELEAELRAIHNGKRHTDRD